MPESLWTPDGVPKVYQTPRPFDTRTYFSGAGDGPGGIGTGDLLIFHLGVTDVKKTVTISYNELVYIKDGYLIYEGAPLGARLDAQIIAPGDIVMGHMCKNVLFFGNGFIPLDTEDRAEVPVGLSLRITVHNSDGLLGRDPATAFRVVGRIEMYRANTI